MKSPKFSRVSLLWLAGAAIAFAGLPIWQPAWAQESEPQPKPPQSDYSQVVAELRTTIEDEMQRGILTGVSVALIDGERTVFEGGFGWANRERQVPAAADTLYRVGSISKLFTAVAVMQLVEVGKLDLDAPITKWLPDFRIVDPFESASPITLRQLMCHRSGMVRESPVGGYLDDRQPSPEQSIASLASCVLVNPPGTKTRYSNIGVTIEGQCAVAASGMSFEDYQMKYVLTPLGMTSSSWRADEQVRQKLAQGYMRVADDRGGFFFRPAPLFELGTIPAANLYSSVSDIARFCKMLLAGGKSGQATLLQPTSLALMSTPQLTTNPNGFGLGFFAGRFGKYRTLQHTGAVYGFSTSVVAIPELQIAVIVFANDDIVMGPVDRISDTALELLRRAKTGEAVASVPATVSSNTEDLSRFAGDFESPVHWAKITLQDGALKLDLAGQPFTLRQIGPQSFEANGRFAYRAPVEFRIGADGVVNGFMALDQSFSRANPDPPAIPDAWQAYLGSYGPDFIPVVISVHHGHLYAMTENMIDYRLTPINGSVFQMPEGLYADEELIFERDSHGAVHSAVLANMRLPRRP
jgi:serine beta-lactamase-like protein LACTB